METQKENLILGLKGSIANYLFGFDASASFYLFSARTNITFFDIRFKGPKFFISLNNNIQSAATITVSTSRLKHFSFAESQFVNNTVLCFVALC